VVLFSLLQNGILILIILLSVVVLAFRTWLWGLGREAMSLALVLTRLALSTSLIFIRQQCWQKTEEFAHYKYNNNGLTCFKLEL